MPGSSNSSAAEREFLSAEMAAGRVTRLLEQLAVIGWVNLKNDPLARPRGPSPSASRSKAVPDINGRVPGPAGILQGVKMISQMILTGSRLIRTRFLGQCEHWGEVSLNPAILTSALVPVQESFRKLLSKKPG